MKKFIISILIVIISGAVAYKGDVIPRFGESDQPINISEKSELASLEPDYNNQVVAINKNKAEFTEKDLSLAKGSWQNFSPLDYLNRVGVANAMLSKEMMPTEEREPLYVNPSGWRNKKVPTGWLYNRCHLIGFQLTGENNNLKNLITGTRSLNNPAMLLYENKVADYIKRTKNHVRYQVKPIFKGSELVARGVQMMAKSIENDQLEFNIYIFNIEPGVDINYSTGESSL
ncbi:DNA/RNA non-specific endonuclease [Listeria booriae]|uniref:DNA/RNA non-specific endonuclease n=1 Tax=Listeria booriae TaxID=1552123 RepID=A0A7X0WGW5_9LIST|nr:DNA/RNA non-specific endonuclease [Listeria booriae]MBC1318501.1 DNA/RNA non-specific endonuclease [Listeria booriae]MBC1333527.1 DNA/RNA non-specific endonuclease [Listeria booriae]MBC2388810.1 DNA/RNA non-specific endonuclease [Listeria booriae]